MPTAVHVRHDVHSRSHLTGKSTRLLGAMNQPQSLNVGLDIPFDVYFLWNNLVWADTLGETSGPSDA